MSNTVLYLPKNFNKNKCIVLKLNQFALLRYKMTLATYSTSPLSAACIKSLRESTEFKIF